MLIADLEFIRRKTEEDEDENWDFRSFVKGWLSWSDSRLDAYVHRVAREVMEQIDCTECGNCCRVTGTEVGKGEITRLADHAGLSVDEFRERHIKVNDYHETILHTTPCPFLNGNLCTVYDDRPRNCREYPYLLKKDFRSRSMGFIENASDCPIVFNTLEIMKKDLWQRRRRR